MRHYRLSFLFIRQLMINIVADYATIWHDK